MDKAIVMRADECQKMAADWGDLTWYASGEQGNAGGMTIGKCVIKPGESNPAHSHPNCSEVLVVMQGKVMHADGTGGEVELNVGDTITVGPDLPHYARNVGKDDAVLFIAFSTPDRQAKGE